MDVLRQDLRAAIAAMRRAPAVSSTAVITLALGIGATLASLDAPRFAAGAMGSFAGVATLLAGIAPLRCAKGCCSA